MSREPEDRDVVEVAQYDLVSSDTPEIGEVTQSILRKFTRWFAERCGLNVSTSERAGREAGNLLVALGLAKAKKVINESDKGRADTIKTYKETAKMDAEMAKLMADAKLAEAQARKTDAEAMEIILRTLETTMGPQLEALRRKYGHVSVEIVEGRPVFFVGVDVREVGPAIEGRAPAGEEEG